MLPATVAMLPVGPVGPAARAAVRTPTPVPAAMRPATTVARPRRGAMARRGLSDCRNMGLLLGGMRPGGSGVSPETLPAVGAPMHGHLGGGAPPSRPPGGGQELSGGASPPAPLIPFALMIS